MSRPAPLLDGRAWECYTGTNKLSGAQQAGGGAYEEGKSVSHPLRLHGRGSEGGLDPLQTASDQEEHGPPGHHPHQGFAPRGKVWPGDGRQPHLDQFTKLFRLLQVQHWPNALGDAGMRTEGCSSTPDNVTYRHSKHVRRVAHAF